MGEVGKKEKLRHDNDATRWHDYEKRKYGAGVALLPLPFCLTGMFLLYVIYCGIFFYTSLTFIWETGEGKNVRFGLLLHFGGRGGWSVGKMRCLQMVIFVRWKELVG